MTESVAVGTELSGFRITGVIGEGGMGIVYRAQRGEDGEEVALKVLRPEFAVDDGLRRRFVRESRYVSSLDHPNVIPVLDSGEAQGVLYVAMPFVRGRSLRELLTQEGPLDPARTLAILAPVADALEAVHAQGLLHRDVKPENILISSGEGAEPPGHCYLTDFGLSKDPGRDSGALTAIGQFVGTLAYNAPEQIMGEELDRRVDVYQLGCVLYECLTCSLPFGEEGAAMDVLHAHLNAPPPRVSEANPHLPAALDEVIATAMAKNPAHRFESCSQLIAAAGEAAGLMTAAAPAPVAGGAPMPAEGPLGLQVTQGNAQGSQILVEDELIIGRLAEDEGRLADDPELSRRHARIFRADDGSWAIEDLGSTNGTFVNGSSVDAPTPLSLSDVISVGNTALVVEAAAAEPPEAAAAEPPEAAAAEPPDLATFPETAEAAVSAPEPAPPAEPEAAPEPAPAPEPEPPEPPGAPEPAPAAPPLAIRVEVDPEAGEARLWLDDETEPVLLRAKGGRWRVVDD